MDTHANTTMQAKGIGLKEVLKNISFLIVIFYAGVTAILYVKVIYILIKNKQHNLNKDTFTFIIMQYFFRTYGFHKICAKNQLKYYFDYKNKSNIIFA